MRTAIIPPAFSYPPAWLDEIRAHAAICEARRPLTRKPSKTGTISEAACLYLRSVLEIFRPKVAIEIGTFIGTSALVLASVCERVYTCDKDNGCVPSDGKISAYPKTTSTAMLQDLAAQGVRAQFFFFDGRIQPEDLPLIHRVSSPYPIYAFDDYEGREKGVVNAELVRQWAGMYVLVPPPARVPLVESTTTIAVMAPGAML